MTIEILLSFKNQIMTFLPGLLGNERSDDLLAFLAPFIQDPFLLQLFCDLKK